jgi:DNA-binding MarR family transcriptional regulator
MCPELRRALLEGLRAAASGAFAPSFYRMKISRRRMKRYRRPGLASLLSPAEARAIQAFWYFDGCSVHELARRFHRNRRTIRKALRGESIP